MIEPNLYILGYNSMEGSLMFVVLYYILFDGHEFLEIEWYQSYQNLWFEGSIILGSNAL